MTVSSTCMGEAIIIPSLKPLISTRASSPSYLCFKNGITITNTTTTTNSTSSNWVTRITIRKSKPWNSRRFTVRSSSDEKKDASSSSSSSSSSSATVMEDEEEWEGGERSPAEMEKGAPSLISALNVQKALRGIAITDADHYGRLGLPRGCSFDQVGAAYQSKVNEFSNQGLDEEELNKKLEDLKESYTILSSEEERRLYDWSLARNDQPERYTWPFEVDITQIPKGTPPPQEPEDVGPTIVVGYFILGWLVLAFVLSIAFNR